MRKIVVEGKTYLFMVGVTACVIADPSLKKKWIVPNNKIKGISQDLIERGRHKGTSDGMIKPLEIVSYIKENLHSV